jgi:Zn-dependent M32 family carboxypeptidase
MSIGQHKQDLDTLRARLREISHISSTLALLRWDLETRMPSKAGAKEVR